MLKAGEGWYSWGDKWLPWIETAANGISIPAQRNVAEEVRAG
ncbi:hypothetical protein [Bacteroides bouchesdurhonensis]